MHKITITVLIDHGYDEDLLDYLKETVHDALVDDELLDNNIEWNDELLTVKGEEI